MKRNENKNNFTFENPDLAAFIKINQNVNPKPFMRPDGKVLFVFDKDVNKSLDDYAKNKPIGAQDLITAIRAVRSMMYAFKAERRT
jgi:hypothetical protein